MTFSNMTIRHSLGVFGEAIFHMSNTGAIADLSLDGVIFDGEGPAGVQVHGILGKGLIGTVSVTGCTFEDIGNWAVFDSAPTGVGAAGLTGFVFTDNIVRDNDGAIALRGAPLAGVVPTTSSTVVTGNSFTNMNTSQHAGPCVYGPNSCGWAGIEVTRVTTATVTDNIFDNLQLGSFGEGEGLQAWMITTLTVTGNTFSNSDSGIEIAFQDTNPVNASINDNSFSNLNRAIGAWDAGVFLTGASSTAGIDASCNYWGNDNGPLVAGQNDHTANGETYGDELIGTMVYALWRTGSVAGA
jgi:hypothetical protein